MTANAQGGRNITIVRCQSSGPGIFQAPDMQGFSVPIQASGRRSIGPSASVRLANGRADCQDNPPESGGLSFAAGSCSQVHSWCQTVSMSDLVPAKSLSEFFRRVLDEALASARVDVTELAELYLANLLVEFTAADHLFARDEGGEEPLAVLYCRAMREERSARVRTLRRMGDVSLYKAGFFAGALRRTVVGPDYYIHMGGAAYGQVAALLQGGFADVYGELGRKFGALARVLEVIAARGHARGSPSGMLRVYQAWSEHGGEALEGVLAEVGLLPGRGGLPN
jgi:hypothetical protein